MRFSIDFTEACPLLSSFARRETRKLESSSAWLSIVRVKTAPAISSADHPTDSSLKRVDVAVSSPPLLMERDGHRLQVWCVARFGETINRAERGYEEGLLLHRLPGSIGSGENENVDR